MTSTYAPKCMGSDNPAFIDLDSATASEINRARSLCASCPIRIPCALYALTSGTTPDGYASPAVDVMMGGVACTGSYQSRTSLYRVIGAKEPKPKPKRRTIQLGTPCASCGRPLHRWTRTPEEIPAGHVMHYSRGYCTHCRPALKREVMQYVPKDERRGAGWTVPNRANTAGRAAQRARLAKLAALEATAARHGGTAQDMMTCGALAKELGWGTGRVTSLAEELGAFVKAGGISHCYAPAVRRALEAALSELATRHGGTMQDTMTCNALAVELGCSGEKIFRWANRLNVAVMVGGIRYCYAPLVRQALEVDLSPLEDMAARHGGTMQDMQSCPALARELGCVTETVIRWARKLDVLVKVGGINHCYAPLVRRALSD